MIAPQELRINNLLEYHGWNNDNTPKYFRVRDIFWDDNNIGLTDGIIQVPKTKLDNLKPIKLTEYWLLKFGLRNSETGYEIIVKQTKFSAIRAKGFFSVGLAGPFGLYLVKIKYVHQLQNLYQSVFLEELTIKE